jgi:dTDP-4-amino-4,6-dideoxygalactose transaminase
LIERAEIIWEKGTNRIGFQRGAVDKYTWQDVGSSFVVSELTAAFLWAQLQRGGDITTRRLELWRRYDEALAPLDAAGLLRRPRIPAGAIHNAHIYHVLLRTPAEREAVRRALNRAGIDAIFHYIPLHSAPAGRRFGRVAGSMAVTDHVAACLLRLPLYIDLPPALQDRVVAVLGDVLAGVASG